MAKIEIEISKFNKFIDLVACRGETEEGKVSSNVVKECVINLLNNYIETNAIDETNKLFVNVRMNATVLEPGTITIGDIESFMKYLSRFKPKDKVLIYQNDAIIRIQRNDPPKLVKIITVAKDNIETYKVAELLNKIWQFKDNGKSLVAIQEGKESTRLDNTINVKAEDFMEIIADSKVVGSSYYPFSIEDKNGQKILKVEVGSLKTNMGMIKSIIPVEIDSIELNNKYAYGFENIFSALKGDVKIYTAPNSALWVLKEEQDISVRYMVTGVVDE